MQFCISVYTIVTCDPITTVNSHHVSTAVKGRSSSSPWLAPEVGRWRNKRWSGYRRQDAQVGTRNYWLVIPLVFCENRNIDTLRQAFVEELGFAPPQKYRMMVKRLVRL